MHIKFLSCKVMIEFGWKSKRALGSLHIFLFALFCALFGEHFKNWENTKKLIS